MIEVQTQGYSRPSVPLHSGLPTVFQHTLPHSTHRIGLAINSGLNEVGAHKADPCRRLARRGQEALPLNRLVS